MLLLREVQSAINFTLLIMFPSKPFKLLNHFVLRCARCSMQRSAYLSLRVHLCGNRTAVCSTTAVGTVVDAKRASLWSEKRKLSHLSEESHLYIVQLIRGDHQHLRTSLSLQVDEHEGLRFSDTKIPPVHQCKLK